MQPRAWTAACCKKLSNKGHCRHVVHPLEISRRTYGLLATGRFVGATAGLGAVERVRRRQPGVPARPDKVVLRLHPVGPLEDDLLGDAAISTLAGGGGLGLVGVIAVPLGLFIGSSAPVQALLEPLTDFHPLHAGGGLSFRW
jgi:NitT/TauT family transport system permease protein